VSINGTAGVAASRDGRNVHVVSTDVGNGAVVVFARQKKQADSDGRLGIEGGAPEAPLCELCVRRFALAGFLQ
jgi:hypothetical protein